MKQQNSPARRIAVDAMMIALAMIFSYIETLIPVNFGIPGIKLGLANLVVLTGLYRMRPRDVFLVSLARILLPGFLFGNGFSILYALTGGLLSFLCMYLLVCRRKQKPSPPAVSAAAAVCHNTGQLLAAALIVRTPGVLYYLPVLIAAGLLAGITTGLLAARILRVLP